MSQPLEPDRQAQQAGTSDQHAFQFTRREVLPRLATLGAGAVVFGPADAPPSSGQSSPPEPPPARPAVDVLGVVVSNAGHSLRGFISQAHFAAEMALQEPNLSPKVRRELEWLQRATPRAYRAVGYIRGAAAAAELGPEWLRGIPASMRHFYGVPDDGSDPVWLTWAARSAQSDVTGNCLCMSISTAARGTRVSGDS